MNVLSISGGKDSTALYLSALESGQEFIAVFADTGNEHELTYEYVRRLPEMTGGPPVQWLKADFSGMIERRRRFVARDQRIGRARGGHKLRYTNRQKRTILNILEPTGIPFLDLCLAKGRFPSTRARFCSEELKHRLIYSEVHEPLLDAGESVVSWQGVRADESTPRSCLGMCEPDPRVPEITIYRPIIGWTAGEVFAMHDRHGVEPNPLYKLGFSRVGCMPCLHCGKAEIAAIADRFPEHIARIEQWEKMVSAVSKRGISTFFAADKTPARKPTGVREVARWAKTAHGGRQYLLDFGIEKCTSLYGLCE